MNNTNGGQGAAPGQQQPYHGNYQHGGYQQGYQGYYDNSGYYYNQQQGMHPSYGYQNSQYNQGYYQHHPGHQHGGYAHHAHQQHQHAPQQGYGGPPHQQQQHMQGAGPGGPPAQGPTGGTPAASPSARPPQKQRTRALDIVHPATGVVVVPGSSSTGSSENASPDEGSTNSSPTVPSPNQANNATAAAPAAAASPGASTTASNGKGGNTTTTGAAAKREDGAKGGNKKEEKPQQQQEEAQQQETKEEPKAEIKPAAEAKAAPAEATTSPTATPASSVPATPTKAPTEEAALGNGAASPPASPTTPMSAGGKKRYDVSFLLKFQQAPTECPAEIKKFTEIFIDANATAQSPSPPSGRSDRRGMQRQQQRSPPKGLGDFRTSTPKAGQGPQMPQSPTSPGSRSLFGSAKQRGPNSPKSGYPANGPPPVLPNRAESAFKVTKPDDEKKLTQKTINGLLNKLSPEKYVQLRQNLLDMNLDLGDEDVMEILINAVYERAIAQPLFVELYAQLCHDILREYISKKKQEGGDGEPDGKLFRRKLLEKCQHEFENPIQLPDEAKDWTAEERADRERKLRRRQLGLSRFVGELFKCQILTEKIMHAVIKRLLNGNPPVPDDAYVPSPEEVEVLCKLLSTCGSKLDRKVAADFMNYYFSRLIGLSKTYPDSRLRFLLLDVIDLRANRWETRLPK